MKKYLLAIAFFIITPAMLGCPLCEKQQPKILRGILHGTGPQGQWDYVIVWVAVAIVLLTLFLSIKWLCLPGEKDSQHIKRIILNQA